MILQKVRAYVRLKEELRERWDDAFDEALKLYFTTFPTIERFTWSQRASEWDDNGPSQGLSRDICLNDVVTSYNDFHATNPRDKMEEAQLLAAFQLLTMFTEHVLGTYWDGITMADRSAVTKVWDRVY